MAVRIDSVLHNAVAGVQDGLSKARQASSQLAVASPGDDGEKAGAEATTREKRAVNDARVVKDVDETLGTIVDIKA